MCPDMDESTRIKGPRAGWTTLRLSMDQGESSPSSNGQFCEDTLLIFLCHPASHTPQVLPVPQAGTTTGSQAGFASCRDTLVYCSVRAYLQRSRYEWRCYIGVGCRPSVGQSQSS
jgi:hypothetical protein